MKSSPEQVLSANQEIVLEAAIHAVAALVLHITGEKRIELSKRREYLAVLKGITSLARITGATDVP